MMSIQGRCNLLDEPISTPSGAACVAAGCATGDASPISFRSELMGPGSSAGVTTALVAGRLQRGMSRDSLSIKYKRMKCAVVVMATLMIIASMLLVGVSLAMAEHIDELVRQMNGLGTTRRLQATQPTTTTSTTTMTTSTTTTSTSSTLLLILRSASLTESDSDSSY